MLVNKRCLVFITLFKLRPLINFTTDYKNTRSFRPIAALTVKIGEIAD